MALYSTDDICTASALKTGGMKFLGISKRGNRGIFEFEDSPEREKLITDFYSGDLTQNVREYVNHWVNFKRLVANERELTLLTDEFLTKALRAKSEEIWGGNNGRNQMD